MSELNVTPGEWFVIGRMVMSNVGSQIADADCEEDTVKIYTNESEANAHLMAASKELYEALKRMVKVFGYCDCHHADCNECEKFEFANAALAKARGVS